MNLKALLLLISGHFATDINTGAIPAFLPFIQSSLNLTYTMTAAIMLVFNVTASVIQPFFGYFSDRWSLRWLLPAGCLISSLGMAILGFSPSYAWVLFFVSLSGVGQASYHPEGFKTVNLLAGQKKATAMSIFFFGGNMGFALGPILATFFFIHFGLPGSLWFLLPGLIMMTVFISRPSWKPQENPLSHEEKRSKGPALPRKDLLPMGLLLVVMMIRAGTRMGLMTFIPLYFINILHRDPMTAGKYLSAFLLAGTIGGLGGGPLADRYGYKKIVLLSLSLTPIFLWLSLYTGEPWSLFFFAMAGFVLISSNAVTIAMGQSFMPESLGMASGLFAGLAMGMGGIATTFLGWVADHWGMSLTLQIIVASPILATLVLLFVPYPPAHLAASPRVIYEGRGDLVDPGNQGKLPPRE